MGTKPQAKPEVAATLAEQARARRERRCSLTQARWQKNRRARARIQAEEKHEAYRGWARIQYERLVKAMDDTEAMDEVVVPDERPKMEKASKAQTLALQRRIRALTSFYHIAWQSEKPLAGALSASWGSPSMWTATSARMCRRPGMIMSSPCTPSMRSPTSTSGRHAQGGTSWGQGQSAGHDLLPGRVHLQGVRWGPAEDCPSCVQFPPGALNANNMNWKLGGKKGGDMMAATLEED